MMAAHVRPLTRAKVAAEVLGRVEQPWLAEVWRQELAEALAAADAEFCRIAQREAA
jgi:hypothetical protein